MSRRSNRPTGMNPVDLIALFDLDDEAFRARFRHTPLWRAKRRGLLAQRGHRAGQSTSRRRRTCANEGAR